jgi:tRNA A-37 threonylcarbamoyl transferase component Bud32
MKTTAEDIDRSDCVAALVAFRCLGLCADDITSTEVLDGGLFSYLLRAKTHKGEFYVKKYGPPPGGCAFSPPEASASFRAALAHRTQTLAKQAVRSDRISVPAVMPLPPDGTILVMECVSGTSPLFPFLRDGTVDDDLLVAIARALGQFHQLSAEMAMTNRDFANKDAKEYKMTLQYHNLRDALDVKEAAIVSDVARWYLNEERCVTHGDVTSRNVIIDDAQQSAMLIDFEQSHYGSPAYDLAHFLSEYVISCLHRHRSPHKLLARTIAAHGEIAPAFDPLRVAEEFTLHLACQVIYRFVGPSRHSWTGHIASDVALMIIERARNWVRQWPLPISALI